MPTAIAEATQSAAEAPGPGAPRQQVEGSTLTPVSQVPQKAECKAETGDPRIGKYLAFLLGREEFAIQVLKVREIMGI